MKKIILALMLTTSFTSFSARQSFDCKTISLRDGSKTPMSIILNTDLETAVINMNGETEQGQLSSDSDVYKVSLYSGTDTMQFFIAHNEELDLVEQYVNAMADEYGMSEEDAQSAKAKILEVAGEDTINGTMVILAQVSSFLSCKLK